MTLHEGAPVTGAGYRARVMYVAVRGPCVAACLSCLASGLFGCGGDASAPLGFEQLDVPGSGGGAASSTASGAPSPPDDDAPPNDAPPNDAPPVGETPEAPHTCSGKKGRGSGLVTVMHDGLPRTAWLHVPPGYDPSAGTMLVLNFHGFTSDAAQQMLLSEMNGASDARGFLVVYPQGVARSWNAGACCGTAWLDAVDDVGFVEALLDELSDELCIDPRRIYATGMSNGGFLSHRLACELSGTFAAIAPVAGVLGVEPEDCTPPRPVPVMHIHGTADPVVPYEGSLTFASVEETVARWRQLDGCSTNSSPLVDQGDAWCVSWSDCDEGAEVVRCTIEGGGHTWPGGFPIPLVGKTSTDLDATGAMLDFFDAHPLP